MIAANDLLLSRLKELKLTPTGEYEVSGFVSIDNAVATYLSRIFDDARVNTLSVENKAFNRFVESPPADRVVVGKFDSVVEFLQAWRRGNANRRSKIDIPGYNREALPVINVSRTFDVVYSGSEHKRDTAHRVGADIIYGAKDRPMAVLDRTQAALSYTVSVLSAEKETLSLILNTMTLHLRFAAHYSFPVTVNIANADIDLDCTFTDSKDLIWSDSSAPVSTERLFAAMITLTVNTDVVRALAVNPSTETVEVISSAGGGQ